MTNTRTNTGTVVANEGDPFAEVRGWVAGRVRFEHLLGSLERQVGLVSEAVRSPRP